MSEDLHNNPPFEILQTELGPENNADVKTYKTGGECLYFYLYCLFRVKLNKKCNYEPVFLALSSWLVTVWLSASSPWPMSLC